MDFNSNGQFNNNSQNGSVDNGQNAGFNGYNQPLQNNIPLQKYSVPPYYPVMPQYVPNPQDEQKRKDKKILKTMGFSFGLAIILYFVLSSVVVALLYLSSNFIPSVEALLNDSTGIYALEGFVSVFFIGGSFLISYLILKKKKYIGVLPFGTTYNKKAAASLVMFLAPVVLISTIIINLISSIFQKAVGITFESGLEDMTAEGMSGAIMLTFTLAVIPAIVEEFCIRGVVLQPLRRYGDKFAIVMSAAIFSILHGNMVQIPYTLVAGIYFGYLCVATGSLWPSIILHFINNMFSVIELVILSNYGEETSAKAIMLMLGLLIAVGIAGGVIFFNMHYKANLKNGVGTLKTGEKVVSVLKSPAMIIAIIFMLIYTARSVSF